MVEPRSIASRVRQWWRRRDVPGRDQALHDLLFTELDAFRELRDNLWLRRVGDASHAVAICKSHRREGSTRVACHLALAFASDPRVRVALVDSDLHHPGLHGLLQVEPEEGVYETLIEDPDVVKDRIKKTRLPNLSVVTAGTGFGRLLPQFGPSDFRLMLQALKRDFSVIIVDTSPVLDSAVAGAVASQCDSAVLVVRADQTRWEEAQEAQARLEQAGATVLGVVMNQRRFPIPGFLYKRL